MHVLSCSVGGVNRLTPSRSCLNGVTGIQIKPEYISLDYGFSLIESKMDSKVQGEMAIHGLQNKQKTQQAYWYLYQMHPHPWHFFIFNALSLVSRTKQLEQA